MTTLQCWWHAQHNWDASHSLVLGHNWLSVRWKQQEIHPEASGRDLYENLHSGDLCQNRDGNSLLLPRSLNQSRCQVWEIRANRLGYWLRHNVQGWYCSCGHRESDLKKRRPCSPQWWASCLRQWMFSPSLTLKSLTVIFHIFPFLEKLNQSLHLVWFRNKTCLW